MTDPTARCPRCTAKYYSFEITPKSIHYGKYRCKNCGGVWYPKDPTKTHRRKVKRLRIDIDYCEICLRKADNLGLRNTLQEHHILPYLTHPELDEEPKNRLVVCSLCHNLINVIQRLVETFTYEKETNNNGID